MPSGIDVGIGRERERCVRLLNAAMKAANEQVTAAKNAPMRKGAYLAFEALQKVRDQVLTGEEPKT